MYRNIISFVLIVLATILCDILCADRTNLQQNAWTQVTTNQDSVIQLNPNSKTTTTPWPELGQRPTRRKSTGNQNSRLDTISAQNAFIRNEQTQYINGPINNQNVQTNNNQNKLIRQDTFVVTPKTQQTGQNFMHTNGKNSMMGQSNVYNNVPNQPQNSMQNANAQSSMTVQGNLMRQDTFVVPNKPQNSMQNANGKNTMMGQSNLMKQDTFVIPNGQQGSMQNVNGKNTLIRQDTFIVKPNDQKSSTQKPVTHNGQNTLMRQDTFVVNPNNNDNKGSQNPWGKPNVPNQSNKGIPPVLPTPSSPPVWVSQNRSAWVTTKKPNQNVGPNRSSSTGSSVSNLGSTNDYIPPSGNVSEDDEIREFSENLLKKDVNNAAKYVTINYQRMTTSRSRNDEAPSPLLTIDKAAYNIPSVEKLMLLYNNYILETNMNEVYTAQEKIEENNLLDTIMQTPVMQYTRNFLIRKGKLGKDPKEFKDLLRQIWFNMYSRGGGRIGSSGFEHVFLAEIKNNDVSGLHNWLYFSAEESKNKANYLGYLKKIEFGDKGAIIKYHFTFNNKDKPVGSMFIGTSPEFEIALYSTCFLLRADGICPLKLGGNRFIIRTFSYRYRGKNLIGSAFPEI